MKTLYCECCGSHQLEDRGDKYFCPHCGAMAEKRTVDEVYAKLSRMFDDAKQEHIANLRRMLYEAAHEEYTDSVKIVERARKLREMLSDDFQAKFYEAANTLPAQEFAKLLSGIDVNEYEIYVADIIEFTLKSLQPEYMLALNAFIERAYKQKDLLLYDKYATLCSEEQKKLDESVYDVTLPRDVFVAYSSADMDKVGELVSVLEDEGLTCFVAMRNLQHGRGAVANYEKRLQEAMDNCRAVVLVSSVRSRTSGDARKVELRYVRQRDLDRAPAEYGNDYAKLPAKYKKPRVEYLVENYRGTAAERFTKEFFNGYEYRYDPKEVAAALYDIFDDVANESTIDDTASVVYKDDAKYCLECGARCDADFLLCPKCGNKTFVATHEEYLTAKQNQKHEEELARIKAEMQKQLDEMKKALEEAAAKTAAARVQAAEMAAMKKSISAEDAEKLNAEGNALYDKGEYTAAVEKYKIAAESGNASAQARLGWCYDQGHGVEQNFEQAVQWYKKSAGQDNAWAQCHLAWCYEHGQGIEQNSEQAIYWYKKSAEQGEPYAQCNLAKCYEDGKGVEKDTDQAIYWYKKSAEQDVQYAKDAPERIERDLQSHKQAEVQPYKMSGRFVTFGSYPQSRVTDENLISGLNSLAGEKPSKVNRGKWNDYGYYINSRKSEYMWYIDLKYQGAKYRGVYFTSYRPYYTTYSSSSGNSNQDDNGYYINTLYWFKWEPIEWRVLEKTGGEAFLMSNVILDSQQYYRTDSGTCTIDGKTVYPNNYKESDIRAWLNGSFYNWAFDELEQGIIKTTLVDNSASTTSSSSDKYVCENTDDKVFLLSYKDVLNTKYGFNSSGSNHDTARRLKTTGYAQSQGASTSTDRDYKGNGWWWLRSPGYDDGGYACDVNDYGDVGSYYYVFHTNYGVVPALRITL